MSNITITPQRWVRIALGYLSVISGQIGLWALLAPRSFYDSFPGLGRVWVAVDGPYNEHLVRDVGALNLALAGLFIIAWRRLEPSLVTASGVVAMLWGVPHALYHLANFGDLDTGDAVISLMGLVFFVVAGGGLVWAARNLGHGVAHEFDEVTA